MPTAARTIDLSVNLKCAFQENLYRIYVSKKKPSQAIANCN